MNGPSTPFPAMDTRLWRAALGALIVVYLGIVCYRMLQNLGYLPLGGQNDGYDFMAFWSAAVLLLEGDPAAAYQIDHLRVIQDRIFPVDVGVYPWLYPPHFQLAMAPLGMFPFVAAFAFWTLATTALLCAVVWRFVPGSIPILLLLSAPLTDRVFATGQTSFLTAALLGLFALDLDRRHWRAGLWLGLLTLKPQLGVLIPFALLLGGHWRTFAAATITTALLAALSLAVFGADAWSAFFESLGFTGAALARSENILVVIATVFSALRLFGVESATAFGVHFAISAIVALAIGWVWLRPFRVDLKVACLLAGSCLISPYQYDYDFMVLAISAAILARNALRGGWLKGEPHGLILIWFLPMVATVLATTTGIQLGFVTPALVLALCLRRAVVMERASRNAGDRATETGQAGQE